YSSLFSSAESAFLLSSPAREDRIFAYKYQAAVAFSSWAFVLLGSPILIAYGIVVGDGAPWYFYAVLPLYFIGFVLLPRALGALICLVLVNFVPRHRKQIVLLVVVALAVGLAWWIYSWASTIRGLDLSRDWVNELLGEVSLIRVVFLPAHWIARGLQDAALGAAGWMGYNLCLVWANGLLVYVVTAWAASKLYRRGFNRVVTGGTLRRRYGGAWLDNSLSKILFFLDPQTRLLIVKDFRTF